MRKLMPIQGLILSKSIYADLKIRAVLNNSYSYKDKIIFLNNNDYMKNKENFENDFLGLENIKEFDSIVIYETQSHNTAEVFNLKILISALYFTERLATSRKVKSCIYESDLSNNEFFNNYHLDGYFTDDYIKSDKWYVKLGNKKITRDDFDQFIVRAFSDELIDEYSRQNNFKPYTTQIEVNNRFLIKLEKVLLKINSEDKYSMKLKSVFMLYYKVLLDSDMNDTIVTYAIILEALLLRENEENSSKKVACRSACLLANEQPKTRKNFIANAIYKLYLYRSEIVHEGKNFLELGEESSIRAIMKITRHTIYLIIKYIIENNIKEVSEIENIVIDNKEKDDIDNAFKYVTINRNEPVHIIYNDE